MSGALNAENVFLPYHRQSGTSQLLLHQERSLKNAIAKLLNTEQDIQKKATQGHFKFANFGETGRP